MKLKAEIRAKEIERLLENDKLLEAVSLVLDFPQAFFSAGSELHKQYRAEAIALSARFADHHNAYYKTAPADWRAVRSALIADIANTV